MTQDRLLELRSGFETAFIKNVIKKQCQIARSEEFPSRGVGLRD